MTKYARVRRQCICIKFKAIAIELKDKTILGIRISCERSMLIAEQFMQSLVRKYGKLEHISNWFRMFIDMHNRSIIYSSVKLTQPNITGRNLVFDHVHILTIEVWKHQGNK
jgi:hypothetical protein